MNKPLSDAAVARLSRLAQLSDAEVAHHEADKVLCYVLDQLGYRDVVEAWKKVPRWYA